MISKNKVTQCINLQSIKLIFKKEINLVPFFYFLVVPTFTAYLLFLPYATIKYSPVFDYINIEILIFSILFFLINFILIRKFGIFAYSSLQTILFFLLLQFTVDFKIIQRWDAFSYYIETNLLVNRNFYKVLLMSKSPLHILYHTLFRLLPFSDSICISIGGFVLNFFLGFVTVKIAQLIGLRKNYALFAGAITSILPSTALMMSTMLPHHLFSLLIYTAFYLAIKEHKSKKLRNFFISV